MIKYFFSNLNSIDENLLIWINHSWSTHLLNYIFFGVSFSASWIGMVLYTGIDIFMITDRRWKAGFLFTLILTGVIFESLKFIVDRERPYQLLNLVTPYGTAGLDPSFPSGHTSFAFAIASYANTRSRSISFYIWAFAVGLSRLYLGVHYPSDVLGGIVVGILTGKMVKLFTGGKK